MLFPNLADQYWNESDRHLIQKMEEFYQTSVTMNQQYWAEADVDHRFYAGDQTIWNYIYGNIPLGNRRQFNFNKIRRIINMPAGYQRQNRKSTIVIPVENGSQQTADQFTKVMMWNDRQENIPHTISEAFHGGLIAGMNLLQVWMDWREDPVSGSVKVSNCSYNSFIIDPYFRNPDLSDCNGIWKRTYLSPLECMALIPDRADQIPGFENAGYRDGKFYYMPENFNYDMKKLLTYDEYYYKAYRKQKMLVDRQNGETMEWTGSEEMLRAYLQQYPEVDVIDNMTPTVNCAIVVQGKVLYHDRNPMEIDCYPFVPVFSYYEPNLPYFEWRIQGMVRNLRDPQYLYNRRKIIELDIMESQINSGIKAKEDSFVDPKAPYKTGQGQVLWLKKEAQMADVEVIQAPSIPSAMFQASETLDKMMNDISGVNEELLGASEKDIAGFLARQRTAQGLVTLQDVFDKVDLSQQILGRIRLQLFQKHFTPGKVAKILGEQPTEEFYSKNFLKYDVAIEEGFNTTTQKQMQFAQMLELRQVGVPIPDEALLDACTMQNKDKIIQQMQQMQQQAQQQQQQQAEMAMQEQMAKFNLASAQAEAERGLGMERMSNIQVNQAASIEKQAKTQMDYDKSLLDLAKALKELDGIDVENIHKLLQLSQVMKLHEGQQIQQGPSPIDQAMQLMQQQQQEINKGQSVAKPPMEGLSS